MKTLQENRCAYQEGGKGHSHSNGISRDEPANRSSLPSKFGRFDPCPQDGGKGGKVEDFGNNANCDENDLHHEQEEAKEDVSGVVDEHLHPDLLGRLYLRVVHG